MKRKITAAALCVLMLFTLFGCASSPVVMSYEGKEVTANMYRYWLSTYKGSFMNTYSDMHDTDEFWNSLITDDLTAEQYLTGAVRDNVKRTLVCASLFDSLGLEMSDADKANIDAYIENLITERADGSRNSFNQILGQYGINIDMLRRIYQMEDTVSLLFAHLYGTGGTRALTDADLAAYCAENYVRVQHIYVNDAYVYETDENGGYSYDATGTLKTRALTDAEAAEKAKKIADIESALSKGQEFESVYQQYSEDRYYDNGYYLSGTTNFVTEVVIAAMNLEMNHWVRVDSDFGVHFIRRIEMETTPYKNEVNADFFEGFEEAAKNADFYEYLEALLPAVTVDEEALNAYSIREAVPNYSI